MFEFKFKIFHKRSHTGGVEKVAEASSRAEATDIILGHVLRDLGVDEDLIRKIDRNKLNWTILGPYDDDDNLLTLVDFDFE